MSAIESGSPGARERRLSKSIWRKAIAGRWDVAAGLRLLQLDQSLGNLGRSGRRRPNGPAVPAGAAAAPSSLLLVRISPSVIDREAAPALATPGPSFIGAAAAGPRAPRSARIHRSSPAP